MKYKKYLIFSILSFCAGITACDDSKNDAVQCESGQKYNYMTKACEAICTGDTDCSTNYICADELCVPKPALGCTSNSDCKNGRVCVDGACEYPEKPQCAVDADCGEGNVCVANKCYTGSQDSCISDDDCGENKVCINSQCEVKPADTCNSDDDCGENKVCINSQCKDKPAGTCNSDDDCATGQACIETQCVPKQCSSDEECGENMACVENQCAAKDQQQTCENNEDCKPGNVCVEKQCIPECTEDSCGKGMMCEEGVCVTDPLYCEDDLACPAGLYCVNEHCRDASFECNDDSECTDSKVCRGNKCVPECQKTEDCSGGFVCKKQKCQPECYDNSDCAAGERCIDSKCSSACTSNDDCIDPYSCIDYKCTPECQKTEDCKDSKLCSNMKCVECIGDSDCAGNDYVCAENACILARDVRYVCVITGDEYTIVKEASKYESPVNEDGSINICKLGYHPSLNEIEADPTKDTCLPFYKARSWDFYGDGVDSNCDGYDYDLKNAIFVNEVHQGTTTGSDGNTGHYDAEKGEIAPLATLQKAFEGKQITLQIGNGIYIYYPDILVSKGILPQLNAPLKYPANITSELNTIPPMATLSNASYKSVYAFHSALVKAYMQDTSFKAEGYTAWTEEIPEASLRIYGGMTASSTNNLLWTNQNDDVSKQVWDVADLTDKSYILFSSAATTTPVSLRMNHFEMAMKSEKTSPEAGTTFVGFSCGQSGCAYLNLDNTTWNIVAPNGIDRTEVLENGEDGYAGKDGSYRVDEDQAGYEASSWCTVKQICGKSAAEVEALSTEEIAKITDGMGACGGYALSETKMTTTNYTGTPEGANGNTGMSIMDASEQVVAKGGDGGKGVADAGFSNKSCNKNTDIDPAKGVGGDGAIGANGINGSSDALEFSIQSNEEKTALYIASNYAELSGLNGSDGAQGGGGGSGAVYQLYSHSTADDAWVSGGSGGNGGCGGKGGLAGGTGGSAIGLITMPAQSGKIEISLNNTKFLATAGNGGIAQSGSDGGAGGIGGKGAAYAKENSIDVDTQCLKSTPGGNGGNGGGGGAGAGGRAGRAISYLFMCDQKVTDDCANATEETPCFAHSNRVTLTNCGYSLPLQFLARYDDASYGTATSGNNVADPEAAQAGKGAAAGTKTTSGTSQFILSYIGKF